jgi:large subunit ribosomal protein L25
MSELQIKAVKRSEFKRSISRTLRKSGLIPGVYYGSSVSGIPIAIKELELRPVIFTDESYIINLSIEGENAPRNCVLKETQFDPISGKPIHFDLFAVKEGEKLTIEVSVKLVGNAPGVKNGGVLQHSLHKLEIECLPQNIPSHIDVDVSNLNIGDSIKAGDITIEGVEILNDANTGIVSVLSPVKEEEEKKPEETTEEKVAEPEVISKGKKEKEEEE